MAVQLAPDLLACAPELLVVMWCVEQMDETTFMYLTCDLPAPPLYPDEMRENIIPQVPLFGILNKFNGVVEKEYKTYKDSTLKRFEITQLPPFIILYIKVRWLNVTTSSIHNPLHQGSLTQCHNFLHS